MIIKNTIQCLVVFVAQAFPQQVCTSTPVGNLLLFPVCLSILEVLFYWTVSNQHGFPFYKEELRGKNALLYFTMPGTRLQEHKL